MRQLILINLLFLLLASCSRHDRREAIFIDDIRQPKEQLEKLDSSEIFSYNKYLPGKAPQFYYSGKDTTVIVVKTKKVETTLQKERYALLKHFLHSVDNGANILIVVDGILCQPGAQKELRTLPSNSLSYVDTMEFHAAQQLYGPLARPTTLIINTYSPKYNRTP
ncbi:hypothetical protein [Ferruginibacter sp.]